MVRNVASNGKFCRLLPEKENTALIGLFTRRSHGTTPPCWMANDALSEGILNKETLSFKKLISFLFKVALLRLPSSKVFLVLWDRFDHGKGPLAFTTPYESTGKALPLEALENRSTKTETWKLGRGEMVRLKGAVSRNSAKLGHYKMPVKLRETKITA